MIEEDIFIGNNSKKQTLEFKLLEFALIINMDLYNEGRIDRNVYDKMRKSILKKMTELLA